MKSFNLSRLLFVCLLFTGLVHAQGVGASGDIRGTVTDPSGAIVSGATVTVTDAAKGTKHTATSDADGEFRVFGLLPATYNVSISKSGFQPEIAKGVVVSIGQTSKMDFHLKISQVSESVEVTAEVPVVEVERGGQADTISQQNIENLPINRRDYLTFTLLAPAVNDSRVVASDAANGFRVKQTPQSGLSFYSSNGRGNSVTVDGGEANDDAGGVRLNVGQDAVQEFQINRSNYNADLGGASGATINIVTKSGSNNVHGTMFGFFRNDAMDAASPLSKTQALAPGQVFNPTGPNLFATKAKDTLTREQFGASIGFPIRKDKTFLFSAFEGLMQDRQNSVPLLTSTSIFRPDTSPLNNQQAIISQLANLSGNPSVPCLTGQPALPAATCAAILTNILTVSNVPTASPLSKFLVGQFENNGGLFPFNTRQYLFSTRLDHNFNDRNTLNIRYNFGHDHEENPDVQSLTGFSRGSSINPAYDHTLNVGWIHQFSPKTQNEARAQYNYSVFDVIPNGTGQVGLDINGFGTFGTQIFLPSLTIMRRYEFADNFTTIRGRHTLKFGAYELYRGNHSESHTFFPGRFVFGNLPGGVLSPCLQVPAACGLTAQAAVINAVQSANLGLPQFYQQGFGNPVYNYPRPFTAAYAQDSWNVSSNFTLNFGVRYELDSQYGALNTDKNNIAPRVNFAWNPFKDGKTVIRGGYGIFYSPVYGQIADVVQTLGLVNGNRQIAQIFVPLTGVPGFPPSLTSAAIFQTLFAQGKITCPNGAAPGQAACITPADLTQFGINITHTGPVPPLTVLFSGQSDYQNPYSQQAEFGIERQIGNSWSIGVSGVYVHTIGLPVALDRNVLPTAPFSNVTLANGAVVRVQNWNTSTSNVLTPGLAPCGGAAIVTCFANPLLLQDNVYSSKGSSVYEGGILEVKKRFSQHFSLMSSYTYSKGFDTTTDFNSDFAPVNELNLAGERALSDFDQRHKLVIAGVVDTGGKGNSFFSGWQVSPILRYNSGHPFNLLASGTDINGDRHSTNDRPIGAARNTGLGPDFLQFDMRLTKSIKMSERASVNLIAEGFNLFNRANYTAVNSQVSPVFGRLPGFTTFNVHGSVANGSGPLGFTAVSDMRQLQLGARIVF